jgi:putative PIN family toxin of toxin-antitoxin system
VDKVDELVYVLEQCAEILPAATAIKPVSRDPADDYLLDLSKRGKAHLLITGDEDLLVLKKHGRTRIISPAQFVSEFLS